MANRIILKKSSVAAKVPLTTDLEYGEIALNYSDEKLYFKNASNAIKSFSAVDWAKRSVRVATTANITLSGTQTIDGIAVVAGDRVLVKDQTTASQNGIYVVSASTWTRAAGTDTALEMAGAVVVVESGTANGGYHYNTDFKSTDTLGTTALSFYRVVDFFDIAEAATASKIPIRSSGGDINMRYGVTQYVSMSHAAAARTTDTVFYSSTDNYIRKNTAAGFKTSLALNNVENTALSTWAGSTNLTTLGTIGTGTWQGSAISDTYLSTISTAGKVANSATTATNANTASAIVARDASGNFSAGTITAALSGNASTATTLQTARTINGVSFNGSANITVTASTTNVLTIGTGLSGTSFNGGSAVTIAIDSTVATLTGTQTLINKTISGASNTLSNIPNSALTNSTISGVALGSNLNTLTRGTYLTGSNFNGSAATTWAVDATSANTASKVVARDASGNFSAGTVTAALSGNATTATTLQTARTINTVSFNGSANIVVEPYVENDDSTNATRYITFVDSSTAGHQRLNEDSNFTINPSTGTVTTNGAFASIFSLNKNTIDTSYSIPSGYNATSAGPVVINNGIAVTIPTGSTWVIV